jgi:transposase
MNQYTTFIALDAHKKEHKVAMILNNGATLEQWTIRNTDREIKRMVRQVRSKSDGPILVCYEAGVCGFALRRKMATDGVDCQVIAPSLIPVKPGERVKTDRRDAAKLVKLLRAGMLTEVHPPNPQEESARDLCRCRQAAQEDLGRIRHQILKFLLRRGFHYSDGSHWTQKHLQWLKGIRLAEPIDQIVLAEYVSELQHQLARVEQLTQLVEDVSRQAPYATPVGWLRCFCGIDTITALTLVSELFSFERFASPRQLMSYLGLTPSERSSGETEKKGGISKAGNRRVRRVLIEAAWHQRHRPVPSHALKQRRQGQAAEVIAIAERCHKRLHKRYWYLLHAGKPPQKVTTAIAREMVGFLWQVLSQPHAITGNRDVA